MSDWEVVYKSAYNKDGSLLFPERLSEDFLQKARKSMGSFLFANQYLNQVIPDDAKSFKKEWLRYYNQDPVGAYSFAFIDPAIGQKDHHDYTGIAVVDVTEDKNWYLKYAHHERLTPTQIVEKMFQLCKQFNLKGLGIESQAYQEALLYILDERMRQRNVILPVKDIKRQNISKATRILGLVPRFEWGRLYVRPGMTAFEDEFHSFPRGSHDDVLDAIASLEEIVYYPEKEKEDGKKPNPADTQRYEQWYIRELAAGRDPRDQADEGHDF